MKGLKFIPILLALVLFSTIINAVGLVEIFPDQPIDSDNLFCNLEGATDATRDNYNYYWYLDNQLTTVTSWEFPASITSVGDEITCFVTDALGSYLGSDNVIILENSIANAAPDIEIIQPVDGAVFSVGEQITFKALVNDPDAPQLIAFWNFGEEQENAFDFINSFGVGNTVTHTYDEPGVYFVKALASDGELNDIDSIMITITEFQFPLGDPNAVATVSDTIVCAGQNVFFDASDSTDVGFVIVNYEWNFGDGTSANGFVVEHSYSEPGSYTTTLTVTDNFGLTDTDTLVVNVDSCSSPVADAGPDTNVGAGLAVSFDGSNSFDTDCVIVNYEWNFGDGNTGNGVNPSHLYNNAGTYTVALTVTDDDGLTDTDTAIVNVVTFENPVAVINVNSNNVFAGFGLKFDGSNSFDTDGVIVNYEWNFGDGTSANGKIVDHAFSNTGTYTVALTVTDDDGLTGGALVVMNVDDFFKGSDADKPILFIPNVRDFEISKTTALNYKPFYNKGDSVNLLVKLTNEGGFDEDLDLKLFVPEFNYQFNVNNIELDMSQVKLVFVNLDIPKNIDSGIYVARLSLESNEDSDLKNLGYWQFVVA